MRKYESLYKLSQSAETKGDRPWRNLPLESSRSRGIEVTHMQMTLKSWGVRGLEVSSEGNTEAAASQLPLQQGFEG